jgi:hypothetical protein
MKTTVKLFLLVLTISLASCSKSNNDNPSSSSTNKTEQVSGNWTVIYFFDSGKDESSDFSGYTFYFDSGDVLRAVSGSSTYTGTWRIGDSSSDDDSSSNRLVITISGNKEMDHLQHDWIIEKITDNEIRLKDDNLSSGEELRFGR